MNFLLSLIAAVFYALQAVLMAKIARKYDSLFAQTLRGLSFGITMLPLLILSGFISKSNSIDILLFDNTYLLLGAIIFAGLGNWCIASSNIFLPVAYGSAVGQSVTTIFLSVIGVLFFSDILSILQVIFIFMLIVCIFLFVYQRKYPQNNYLYKPMCGYLFACGFGIFISIAFAMVAQLSRNTNPLVVAYFWEFGIGVFLSLLFTIRKLFFRGKAYQINMKLFTKVALYASPTIIGTATYAYALKLGPIPLVGAVLTSSLFFIAIFSSFIFKESLTRKHWVLILFMFILLVLIKLS